MKKVLTILVVLALVAGFAFADTTPTQHSESHSIKIQADVSEVLPAFQMKVVALKDNSSTGLTNAASTGAAEFYKESAGAYTPSSNDGFDVKFNLDENGSVKAIVYVANLAKTTKAFALEFGGGEFDVVRDTTPGKHKPTTITSDVEDAPTGIKSITLGSAATTGNPEEGNATNKIVNVVFDGTKMTAADQPVASAEYAYTGDSKINPTKENEYYYANITMTVTSTY